MDVVKSGSSVTLMRLVEAFDTSTHPFLKSSVVTEEEAQHVPEEGVQGVRS
jgi:hypothetical protein